MINYLNLLHEISAQLYSEFTTGLFPSVGNYSLCNFHLDEIWHFPVQTELFYVY
jgi:hypothetical protein